MYIGALSKVGIFIYSPQRKANPCFIKYSFKSICRFLIFSACPDRTWGVNCGEFCNCRDAATICVGATGCAACAPGRTGGRCDDIDECEAGACSGPAMSCVNSVGSFSCICDDGFVPFVGECISMIILYIILYLQAYLLNLRRSCFY